MKKRLIGFVLIACLMLSLLSVGALAAGEVASGTCGESVTWTLDSAGKLTIRGSGPMANYSGATHAPWYEYRESIKSVVIENGVTMIGVLAFHQCTSLESVSIPSSVTIIAQCSKLKSVTIPEGVTTLGQTAFHSCSGLKSVKLPETLTSMGTYGFVGCTSLESITFPESLTALSAYTLSGCTSLKSVKLPSTITTLSQGFFYNCKSLTSVEIPAKVNTMEEYVFDHCSGLTSVKLNGSMPTIAANAFNGVTAAVFYPTGDSSYTADKKLGYGGTLVWPGEEAFTDVPAGSYFYVPVYWAFDKGVTTGTSPTAFEPYAPCTRAQIVTFLWRVSGCPSVSGGNPFTDVRPDAYYYDAVRWAFQNGITTGTSATTFSPNRACTREQCVTFLWRAAGKPSAGVGSQFKDVKPGQYYTEAIYWALQNGVTTGVSSAQFGIGQKCTRGQIVTFLYRYSQLG